MKEPYDKRRKRQGVDRKLKAERKVEMLQCELKLLKQNNERKLDKIVELCQRADDAGKKNEFILDICAHALIRR